jgi:hypothetical protein
MNVGVLVNDEGAGTEASKRPSIFSTLLSTSDPEKPQLLTPDLCRAPAEVDDTILSVAKNIQQNAVQIQARLGKLTLLT